jgi:hypothetical protein
MRIRPLLGPSDPTWDGSSRPAILAGKGKTGGDTAFSSTMVTATAVVNQAPVLGA